MFTIRLSELVGEIESVIYSKFNNKLFWIKAEITDVKKQPAKKWCFLSFVEKADNTITTKIEAVFWSNTYATIEKFEKITQQTFTSGLEITCCVKVKFHERFGMKLEVQEIVVAYTIGQLELERKQILDQLVSEKYAVLLSNGNYSTFNNTLAKSIVLQRIALITAPNSDGQRDFNQVIKNNKYGYDFEIKEYLTTVQGENASKLILSKLQEIEILKNNYDIVVIVRGGGADTDFKSFNNYELAKYVATFPIPILTGIGHDRNTNIVDLMANQHKTPTEVATYILDYNMNFESDVLLLKDRFFERTEEILNDAQLIIQQFNQRISIAIDYKLKLAKSNLDGYKRILKSANPDTILAKGFAIVKSKGKFVTDINNIEIDSYIETILKNGIIYSTINTLNFTNNDI